MAHFATPDDVGATRTFVAMALIYFVFMVSGALSYRIPPSDWKPAGWTPAAAQGSGKTLMAAGHVHVNRIWRVPQFWLVWMVLCMNVSAGIGVIGMSSPMLQEVFGGRLIGEALSFNELDKTGLMAIAAVAAGFTALLSLFNIGGRFAWASFSDRLGRKRTYMLFFLLGGLLYASIPTIAASGSKLLFVVAFCIIVSMYGGGFSTVPAYLADLFGTQMVGAIHGRLLTAWATAGILGPVIVNNMRDYQLGLGLPRDQVYNQTMYILVGMLAIGFVCNLLVRPVDPKHFMTPAELAEEKRLAHDGPASGGGADDSDASVGAAGLGTRLLPVLAWAAVCIPLAWGIYRTAQSVVMLFR